MTGLFKNYPPLPHHPWGHIWYPLGSVSWTKFSFADQAACEEGYRTCAGVETYKSDATYFYIII